MIELEKEKSKNSYIFFIAWIMMLIHICVANSSYSDHSIKYVSYISFAIIVFKILITKYKKKEIIITLVILMFSIISSYRTSDMRTIWFALFLVGSKNIKFESVVKVSLYTMIVCCSVFIIMSLFGLSSITSVSDVKGVRFSFGLGHPNMASAYYCIITALLCYLRKDKIKIWNIIVLFILGIIVFYLTKCTTGIILSSFYLILVLLLKLNILKNNFVKYSICIFLFLLIAFFSIAPIVYNDNLSYINSLLTGRISQSNYYINKYGINLFGSNVFSDLNSKTTDNILDNGYIRILVVNGLISYVFIVYNYINILKKCLKNEKYNLFTLIAFFVVYMCVENVSTYIFMNVTFLLFKTFIFREDKNEYTKNNKLLLVWKK